MGAMELALIGIGGYLVGAITLTALAYRFRSNLKGDEFEAGIGIVLWPSLFWLPPMWAIAWLLRRP